jgi:hypothetical protein
MAKEQEVVASIVSAKERVIGTAKMLVTTVSSVEKSRAEAPPTQCQIIR